ncbi:hypothetical protein [Sphingobacterium suaedae]|uniref:Uncharacterized protein n=1 Tax=Sphingobacterium suaedae TaxID=1686402 RepID=A0ABW5KIM5_9SPHI
MQYAVYHGQLILEGIAHIKVDVAHTFVDNTYASAGKQHTFVRFALCFVREQLMLANNSSRCAAMQ